MRIGTSGEETLKGMSRWHSRAFGDLARAPPALTLSPAAVL